VTGECKLLNAAECISLTAVMSPPTHFSPLSRSFSTDFLPVGNAPVAPAEANGPLVAAAALTALRGAPGSAEAEEEEKGSEDVVEDGRPEDRDADPVAAAAPEGDEEEEEEDHDSGTDDEVDDPLKPLNKKGMRKFLEDMREVKSVVVLTQNAKSIQKIVDEDEVSAEPPSRIAVSHRHSTHSMYFLRLRHRLCRVSAAGIRESLKQEQLGTTDSAHRHHQSYAVRKRRRGKCAQE